ncbi:MAG: response regulator [Gemmataceae bacterium]
MSTEQQATVLVVEDDPGVARLLQVRLERAGYRVSVANDASRALSILREGNIDLMLLDQSLPGGINGLDFYKQTKEADFDVPAILVTGFQGQEIVLQSLRAGVFDFVPKSSDYIDYLLPTIERVLKKRRTECQLVESEARLGSIICSALDAVLTVDENLQIGTFNPAAEQMFALCQVEAHGQSITRFIPAWSGSLAEKRPVEQTTSPRQIERWETEGVRNDGTRFPVELSVAWVEANRRRFWTCFARDISDRIRAQQERERLIQEQAARKEAEAARTRLEMLLEENSRLYRELQDIDSSKDEFLAILSHELRNPLAPIRNALELIHQEGSASPATQENWGIIQRQVAHLTRLVEDLLDISRIREGKIVLREQPLAIADVVARAVETTRPLIEARKHTLSVMVPPRTLAVQGDRDRLVQVLANLLNNAAKYTPTAGRIELEVRRAGRCIELRVTDTGVGIPAELIGRLYEPFTQNHLTRDRSEGGLGIGLTLVRRLIEMHGGTVEATSAGLGQGSCFIVRLPALDSPIPDAKKQVDERPTQKRRILLVDDQRDSARTLSKLLHAMGHDVETQHDGPAALEAVRSFQPEVVVLDIGLPSMDGYEVARRLRASPTTRPETVLIALTGYGAERDRQQAREAGFDVHLAKPVDPQALRQLLNQPLDQLRRTEPK